MIKKIVIDNFMAHAHTELDLGPGVTILTGPNNTGKSAVVEALRCVATNPDRSPNPAMFIRHGAKEARVAVEMDDGTRVVWVRTKRYAMYELWLPGAEEPEEYHKLQRKVPEDIQAVLRMNMVDLEKTSRPVDIHFGNQREPVFLLNRPDSDAAAFFAASTESAHLLAMQDLLKLRVRDRRREGEALTSDLARIERDLDGLEALPSLELRLEEALGAEAEVTRLERDIPALEGVLAQYRSLDAALGSKQRVAASLGQATPPPESVEIRPLAGILAEMDRAVRHFRTAGSAARALDPLAAPPTLSDAPALARLIDRLADTDRHLRGVQACGRVLDGLADPPRPEDAADLAGLLDRLLTLTYRAARLGRSHAVLRTVEEPPAPEPVDGLRSLLARMRDLSGRVGAQEEALNGLEKDLRKVVDRISGRVEELGRCPTCGQAMTAAEFLDHGGCHGA